MAVDRSNFLLAAAALAAGAIGGWTIHDRTSQVERLPPPPVAPPAQPSAGLPQAPIAVDVVQSTASAAACDDSVGVAGDCPSVGPADEGVCANVMTKRCADFKAAFKPKVAENAVACLRALKGNERCDVARINQCGHAALMTACPEAAPRMKAIFHPGSATAPASVALSDDPNREASPVTKACESVLKTCGNQPLAPTMNDCKQTLAGLNDTGRGNMVECVAAHCTDRGLLGCEAAPKAVTASSLDPTRAAP